MRASAMNPWVGVGAPLPQDDQDEERRDGGERKMQGRDGLNGGLLSRDG